MILIQFVVFRIVLNMSEQSLEFNGTPEISTTRAVAEDTPALYRSGSCATFSAQTAYRGNLSG